MAAETDFPSTGAAFGLLAVLALATFMANLDRQVLILIVEPIRAAFAVSDTSMGLLYGMAYSVCFAVAGLPLGLMVDRHSRRNLLAVGLVVWSVATMACGLAQDFTQLFVARMAVGVGQACLAPATYSMVADMFRREHLGRAAGILGLATSVGAGSALMLGGALLSLFETAGGITLPVVGYVESWRAVFLTAGPPGLIVAATLMTMREPLRRNIAPIASGSMQRQGLADYARYIGTSAGILVPLMVANLANIFVVAGGVAWGPVSLMRRMELSTAEIGFWYGISMIAAGVVGPMVGGYISDRWTRQQRVMPRMLIFLLFLPLELLGQLGLCLGPSPAIAFAGLFLSTLSASAMLVSAYIAVQEICPNHFRGQTVAVMGLLTNILALGFGPALVALLSDNWLHDLSLAILGLVVPSTLLGLAATLVLLVNARRSHEVVSSSGRQPEAR